MVLALGLGGCALNSLGLPGGLPIPPGGGSLSITRTTLVDAVKGRTYLIFIPTLGGTGTLTSCNIIVGALPTGLSVGVDPGNAARCRITGTVATSVAPGAVTFTVRASDSAVPTNTAAQSFTFTVRPEFQILTTTAFLNGVSGRSYGDTTPAVGKTPQLVQTDVGKVVTGVPTGNGPIVAAGCAFTIVGNPGFNLTPAPNAPTAAGQDCPLSSGTTNLGAAGAYSVSVAVTDTPITDPILGGTVVPAGTVNNTATPLALTVNPALTLALAQSTNATPTVALLNAVQGRNYGTGAQAAGAPTYTGAGGLTTTGNYGWCISAGGLPGGFATGPVAVSTNCAAPTTIATATSVTVTAAAAGAAGGPTAFTLRVDDTGNAAVPAAVASSTAPTVGTNLTINALLSLAGNLADPLPDAVVLRTYGGAGFTSVIYTASNGVGAYTFGTPASSGGPASAFPTPMACVAAATTFTCSSAAITGTAGSYPSIPVTVDDAGNAAVPGSVSVPATVTLTRSLTVQPALNFLSVSYVNPLPDAVNGRSWGTGVGFSPLVYTAQNGLGGYSFAISGTSFPTGIACATSGATFTCDTTVAASVSGAAGAYNGILVNANDTANVTTPNAVTSATQPAAVSRDLTVNAAFNVVLGVGSPDPTTPAGHAVIGRTYGVLPQSPVVYQISGGLSTRTISTAGSSLLTDTNITCPVGASTVTCSSAAGVTKSTVGTAADLLITVSDTANSATPGASTGALTYTFTIWPAITFGLAPAPTGLAPNGVIPDGVVGRTYGTPLANLVFTASGGLGNAAGFGLTGTQTGTLSANNIVCSPATAQVGASVTVTCNSSAGGGVVTAPAGASRTLVMTFGDAGNSTTPAGSTNADTAGYNNYSNTIAAALAIALQAGSPDPANANAQAVVGRTYGAAPEAPVVYEVTGGLPGYSFVRSGTLLVNSNICGTQVTTATTLTCNSGGVGVTGTTGALTVTVTDTGNATTSAGSIGLAKTYTVNPVVSMTVSPDPTSPTTTAVIGRAYGIPAGLLSPTYTASGGLAIYTFTVGAPGAGITCVSGATTVVCDSAAVTAVAPASFNVLVTDGSNLTTPADATGVTLTRTFTVNLALTITTASLRNGLVDYTYVPTGPGETVLTTGGLGGNTWVPPGSTGGACTGGFAPTGTIPPGLTLGAATGLISGIPTTESPLVTDYTFNVCVFDTANTTTPSGAALPGASYIVNVLGTYAAAASPGTDTLEVINTTTNLFDSSIALGALSNPMGVAATPNGRKVYVTLNGTNNVKVVDTINGAVTTIGLGTCTGPRGIAIGLPGGLPTAFVACSNGEIAVIDAATDTFVSSGPFGTPLTASFYGVAITPDDSLVYVTDVGNDQFVVLDAISVVEIFGSPFTAGVTTPHGVAISADGNRVYIAGTGSNDVIVLDAADNTTVVAGPISTGALSAPEAFAITPDGARVYVTLNGTNQFSVIDDTLVTPALMAGSPVALAGASAPFGITIPPIDALFLPTTGVRVYIAQSGLNNVAIHNNETVTPFGANAASPIALTALSGPQGIGHIPVPR
ncbi:MAG: YncE family protein [Acidobacteria bacterium]|nr:YncE family protein [Acidobacteriota bacterium]